MHDPGIGRHEAPAALSTPGNAEMRESVSWKKLVAPRIVVARGGKSHERREHAIDTKPGIAALQLDQAAHQETRAGQQHE